jgi:hypothetical protein
MSEKTILARGIHPRRRLEAKVIFQDKRIGKVDKKGLWFQDGNKNFCSYCGKSGHQIEKCWTLYPHLCPKQNQEDVKALTRRQVATSSEVDSLVERFDK